MYGPPPGEWMVDSWSLQASVVGYLVDDTHWDQACLDDGAHGEVERSICVVCGHKEAP